MPTYDYVCTDCGNEFEAFQKMSDAPLDTCPECQGSVKRKIGAGLAPIFKGSGFYITDYKKSATSQAAETKTSSTDSKPAESPAKPASSSGDSAKKAV